MMMMMMMMIMMILLLVLLLQLLLATAKNDGRISSNLSNQFKVPQCGSFAVCLPIGATSCENDHPAVYITEQKYVCPATEAEK